VTQQHPITPPPELVQAWSDEALTASGMFEVKMKFATRAAQWGADQELEACVKWLNSYIPGNEGDRLLRPARRPKPPSLKEQALEALAHILNNSSTKLGADTIRRALEALPD
jgi:hypothetical protein